MTRVNRAEFVERFIRHALIGGVSEEVGHYIRGVKKFVRDEVGNMCSASEVGRLKHV